MAIKTTHRSGYSAGRGDDPHGVTTPSQVRGKYLGGADEDDSGTGRFQSARIGTGSGEVKVPFVHFPQSVNAAWGKNSEVSMDQHPRFGHYEMRGGSMLND